MYIRGQLKHTQIEIELYFYKPYNIAYFYVYDKKHKLLHGHCHNQLLCNTKTGAKIKAKDLYLKTYNT